MLDAPTWIDRMLTAPRFSPYLRVAGGDHRQAVRLYSWNLEVSAAFYGPLHCLELTLRNALHEQLTRQYGSSAWWAAAPLTAESRRTVATTAAAARRWHGARYQPDDVVASLTFGFWVSLLGPSYDRRLWVPVLHRAFPHYRGQRADLHQRFASMLVLRNRIMHHEPIHHRDLGSDHARIYELVGYLSDEVLRELPAFDAVPGVLARRRRPAPREAPLVR